MSRFRLRISILRFPSLMVVALLALAGGVFFAPSVFPGLLDVRTTLLPMVSWFAFLATWTGLATSRLVRMFSIERFGMDTGPLSPEIGFRELAIWGLAAVPLVAEVILRLSGCFHPRLEDIPLRILMALVGLLASYITLLLASLLQHFLGTSLSSDDQQRFDRGDMPYLIFSHRKRLLSWALLAWARQFEFPRWVLRRGLPEWLVRLLGPGYTYAQGTAEKGSLREGHLVAAGFFVLTILVYANGFFSLSPTLARGYLMVCAVGAIAVAILAWFRAGWRKEALLVMLIAGVCFFGALLVLQPAAYGNLEPIPPMASILLIVMLVGWGLSGLGFLFDPGFVPVLATLVVAPFLLNWAGGTTHTMRVLFTGEEARRLESIPASRPEIQAWIHHWQQENRQPEGRPPAMVVVATTGGGIQAAAWTAKVLGELAADARIGTRFGPAVRVISAVSGGSVGTMYFVAAYRNGQPPGPAQAQGILASAERSSLEAVGWGLAYPDFWRGICPECISWTLDRLLQPTIDRGWALERAWGQELLRATGTQGTPTLSGWKRDAEQALRPAVMLNATIAESGVPLLLATTDVKGDPPLTTGHDFFRDCDLSVVTAARLSATFPYVSPMARADTRRCPKAKDLHVADGGYFDNYGIFSLLAWLRDGGLGAYAAAGGRLVVLLQIWAFPDDRDRGPTANWLEQTIGPLLLLNNVRTRGHNLANQTALRDIQAIWAAKGVCVVPVLFTFPAGSTPPLSWHMTESETAAIDKAWKHDKTVLQNRELLRDLLLEQDTATVKQALNAAGCASP